MRESDPVKTLAQAAGATRGKALDANVQQHALSLIVDTIAVVAAGTQHVDHKKLASTTKSVGQSTRLDTGEGADPLVASYLNGAATTVWQLQDGHRMASGHPASHLVPALLAIAEETNASGQQFLEAFVAGYEVGARLGLAMGGLNPLVHDAGTWSTIGAAAGAAHLLTDGDSAAIARAINGCASIVPTFDNATVTQGAAIHHTNIAIGAQMAVLAGRAALSALTTLDDSLPRYFGPRVAQDFDMGRIADGIDAQGKWARHELLKAYIKVHPTCAHLHGLNDAADALIKQYAPDPSAIEKVEIGLYGAAMRYDVHAPTCDLSIRFSARASAACALLHGGLALDTFTFETVSSAPLQHLMALIEVRHDATLDAHYPAGRPCRLEVSMSDGRVLEAFVKEPLGDCTNPLSDQQKHAKALTLLKRRYPHAAEVLFVLDELPNAASLAELTALLRQP
ncbi:MAG: MmgE/PrpD family protein [Pseudomonadota bacterium]